MAYKVDKGSAKDKLLDAYNHREHLNDSLAQDIDRIIKGPHKTFRYVLVTALISKATDERIDPLSLQAKDTSPGAYDARTIAHSVLVKFERDYLPHSLGASNEPFVNKPVRYPRLSSDNAVRRGNDRLTLVSLINVLSQITTSEKAFTYLKSALATMEEISNAYNTKYEIESLEALSSMQVQSILDFICELSTKSCEGEICAVIVSTIEKFYNPSNYSVQAHKVNESGSSSKEVGDVDILDAENKVVCSIEVKDKDFTKEDVQHAITKFKEANLTRTMFVYGRSVNFDRTEVYQVAARYGRIGVYCCVISILDYAKLRLLSVEDITLDVFIKELLQQSKAINAKDETLDWIKDRVKSCLELKN